MGGLGSVPVRMAEIAEELGVEIHLGEAVDRVITENGRAVGIETASGEHRADAVVVNADFAKAMTEMVPNADRRRWTDKKLEKKKYSCSTFMLYLGVDRTYDHLPHHQIYASSTYVENLKDIEDRHVVTWDDPPCTFKTRASPTLSWHQRDARRCTCWFQSRRSPQRQLV